MRWTCQGLDLSCSLRRGSTVTFLVGKARFVFPPLFPAEEKFKMADCPSLHSFRISLHFWDKLNRAMKEVFIARSLFRETDLSVQVDQRESQVIPRHIRAGIVHGRFPSLEATGHRLTTRPGPLICPVQKIWPSSQLQPALFSVFRVFLPPPPPVHALPSLIPICIKQAPAFTRAGSL